VGVGGGGSKNDWESKVTEEGHRLGSKKREQNPNGMEEGRLVSAPILLGRGKGKVSKIIEGSAYQKGTPKQNLRCRGGVQKKTCGKNSGN